MPEDTIPVPEGMPDEPRPDVYGVHDDVLLSQLAALLADRLDDANKSRLMQLLADHPDARELLLMSYEIYRQHADLRSRHTDIGTRDQAEENSKRG